jgi:hypothetical protein
VRIKASLKEVRLKKKVETLFMLDTLIDHNVFEEE